MLTTHTRVLLHCFFSALLPLASSLAAPVDPGGAILVQGTGLTHTYDGQRYLFENVNVALARGAKLALVGTNGAGKSSLMRMLGKLENPESGSVEMSKNVQVAYVEQEPSLPPGALAEEFLFSSSAPAVAALREYRAAAAEAAASTDDENAVKRLGQATSKMDATDGWAIESEMRRLCDSLGVEHLLERKAESLSGGERKRVALAAALLQSPELLLLDEPTNHLDIDAIQWLEGELSSRDLTALIVTHDRAFLSAACQEVLELDRSDVFRHRGTYEDFLQAKQERLEVEGQQAQAQRNKLRAELQWVRRQPKARSTKSKSRLDAFESLSKKLQKAGNKLEAAKGKLTIEAGTQRLGTAVVRFVGASVDAPNGKPVLRDFTYDFNSRDRVGVVGPNGAGKSTLLRALQAKLPLVGGEVSTGETVVFGHYEQTCQLPPDGMRVLELVQEAVAMAPEGGSSGEKDERMARTLLSQFLFPQSRWGERIGQLSGGERRRLQLLTVLAKQPNFLLLDGKSSTGSTRTPESVAPPSCHENPCHEGPCHENPCHEGPCPTRFLGICAALLTSL
jgi:ATP-binding cassette subfamily F protein uup